MMRMGSFYIYFFVFLTCVSVMAPKRCSVNGCMKVGGSMYGFPSDEGQRTQWLSWLEEVNGQRFEKKHVNICPDHFESHVKGVKKLLRGAVPTIHLLSGKNVVNTSVSDIDVEVQNLNTMKTHCDNIGDLSSKNGHMFMNCSDDCVVYETSFSGDSTVIDENAGASAFRSNELECVNMNGMEMHCDDVGDYSSINSNVSINCSPAFVWNETFLRGESVAIDQNSSATAVSTNDLKDVNMNRMEFPCDIMTFPLYSSSDMVLKCSGNGGCQDILSGHEINKSDDVSNTTSALVQISVSEGKTEWEHVSAVVEISVSEGKTDILSSNLSCEKITYDSVFNVDMNSTDSGNLVEMRSLPIVPTVRKRIVKKCCFKNCLSTNLNKTLFAFAKVSRKVDGRYQVDKELLRRCKLWIAASENMNLLKKPIESLFKTHFVCSDHFSNEDYRSHSRMWLKDTAIPSKQDVNIIEVPSKNVAEEFSGLSTDRAVSFGTEDLDTIMNSCCSPEYRLYDKFQELRSQRCKKLSYNFDQRMSSVSRAFCPTCKEMYISYPGMKKAHRRQNLCSKFSADNHMDPGEVPDVLKELTWIEEQLIALVHPVLMVYKLKGCQYGYRGNVINFSQDVKGFAEQLPHKIENLESVITVRFKNFKGESTDFRVRSKKVYDALFWLKANNKYYKHIKIVDNSEANLPEDDNVFNIVPSFDMDIEENDDCDESEINKVTSSGVPMSNFIDQEKQIHSILKWPQQSNDPLNEFMPGLIVCAFPTLFPTGECDLHQDREKKINMNEYFKHLLSFGDERFAKHPTFRFFAFNMWMRHTALSNGNVFVDKNDILSNMNVSQLKEHLKSNPAAMKKLLFMGNNIRGSKPYWNARCGELKDMIDQLGLPTVFLTMSAADLYWPDLLKLLSGKNAEDLNMSERRKLLQENPLIVDIFFHHRVEQYIELVLKPKYEVVDMWYRIEYQHRGSPHVHGLFWFKNAPDVSNYCDLEEGKKKEILEYFNSMISAVMPCPDCPMPTVHPCEKLFNEIIDVEMELSQLLKMVQRHTKCSSGYCLKKNRQSKQTCCRFKFPMELRNESGIEGSEEGADLSYVPERNDERLNKYNPFIISSWRANVDIAPVLSKKAIVHYLAKYVSKSEVKSETFTEICESVCGSLNLSEKAKKAIQRILIKNCVERDISSQEVCHILMGLKLFSSGDRNFVVVNTDDSKWSMISNSGTNEGSNDVLDGNIESRKRIRSFIQKYAERPVFLGNLSLWNVAKLYNIHRWSRSKRANIVRVFPRFQLNSSEENNEKYYKQKVLLHYPWDKDSKSTLKNDNESWKEVYDRLEVFRMENVSCDIQIDRNVVDEFESDSDNHDDDVANEEGMIAARICAARSVPVVEPGTREADLNFNWHYACHKYDEYGDHKFLQNFIENEKKKECIIMENHDFPDVNLSPEQLEIKCLIDEQIQCILNGNDDFDKRVLVQGKAGTGKSLLIKYCVKAVEEHFGVGSCYLLGPTGVAAVNIGGSTIHSGLRIPIKPHQFAPVPSQLLFTIRKKFENVKFLIIDEYSMVGSSLLGMIDLRLREIIGKNELFGGLCVYLFGDFKQLPPCSGDALYKNLCNSALRQQGNLAFQSIQKCIVLKQCFRQNDAKFLDILDRLSVGNSTIEDYDVLSSRFLYNVSYAEKSNFRDAIHLFSKVNQVQDFNNEKLNSLVTDDGNVKPICRIPSKNHGTNAKNVTSDKAGGLSQYLNIAPGVKIMLRSNLWVSKGLVNGSIGEVVDIVFSENQIPFNDLPSIVMCKFDAYRGPGIGPDNLVPIVPIVSHFMLDKVKCSRQQFPLNVCYACSIHKSQGLTLEKAVIDIGPDEFSVGLAYVGFSRVKTLGGLLIEPFHFHRLQCLKQKKEMRDRIWFENNFFNTMSI